VIDKERDRSLLKMYELAADRLEQPVTADTYEDMVAYLLGREGLEESPQLAAKLHRLDARFANALAAASRDWWREVTKISFRTGFAQSAWWQNILRLAAEEPEPLKKAVGR
jgi:hypothetical protein